MTRSRLHITQASPEDDRVLANLMNHYIYDMAEWFDLSSDIEGFYAYPIDVMWADTFDVYIARLDGVPIGFALIEMIDDLHDLKEFFIVRRHRRARFGKGFCGYVWGARRGAWRVRVFCGNRPAVQFWERVISDYTEGMYTEENIKKDDKQWVYYHFNHEGS
jgi:predicted acetyltransferase